MKLAELFNQGKTIFSLEVFPPKRDNPIATIYNTLDQLQDVEPDFISVTYGASGSILRCDLYTFKGLSGGAVR